MSGRYPHELVDGHAFHPARMWRSISGVAQCHLCPHRCVLDDDRTGLCGVRAVRSGDVVTFAYGEDLDLIAEGIEAHAVHYFGPGIRVLSVLPAGPVTSPPSVSAPPVSSAPLTAQDIVHAALVHEVEAVAWAVEDPVLRQELVLDTANLAREHGLLNVFRSNLFITVPALTELADVIDVFSVVIRASDVLPGEIVQGGLGPVLEATEYAVRLGRHVEIELTLNDPGPAVDRARQLARWMVEHLPPGVPLHLTPLGAEGSLLREVDRARKAALAVGLTTCSIRGVDGHRAASSWCSTCGNLLVERFTWSTGVSRGLRSDARCGACAAPQEFTMVRRTPPLPAPADDGRTESSRHWPEAFAALLVEAVNTTDVPALVSVHAVDSTDNATVLRTVTLPGRTALRFVEAAQGADDQGIRLLCPNTVQVTYSEVGRAAGGSRGLTRAEL